jgi:hypothetical protein
MDSGTKITISNLGMFFIVMVANFVYILVYIILKPFASLFRPFANVRRRMTKLIYWELLIVLGIEGYLDFCLSVPVNLE